jgi:hypothetical protein
MKREIKLEKVVGAEGANLWTGRLMVEPFAGRGYTSVFLDVDELRELAAMALAVANDIEASK